jgi:hypothetical protein
MPGLDPQHWFCVGDLSCTGIVRILGDLVLSGCYDNTVNIFGIQGDKKLVIPGHSGPVKVREKILSYCQQCCGPGMFIPDPNFFHPGSKFKNIPDPGSASKNSIFSPKNCFQAVGNMIQDVQCSSRILIFFTHHRSGSRGENSTGYGSATLIVSGSDPHDPEPVTCLNVYPDPAFANTLE